MDLSCLAGADPFFQSFVTLVLMKLPAHAKQSGVGHMLLGPSAPFANATLKARLLLHILLSRGCRQHFVLLLYLLEGLIIDGCSGHNDMLLILCFEHLRTVVLELSNCANQAFSLLVG